MGKMRHILEFLCDAKLNVRTKLWKPFIEYLNAWASSNDSILFRKIECKKGWVFVWISKKGSWVPIPIETPWVNPTTMPIKMIRLWEYITLRCYLDRRQSQQDKLHYQNQESDLYSLIVYEAREKVPTQLALVRHMPIEYVLHFRSIRYRQQTEIKRGRKYNYH